MKLLVSVRDPHEAADAIAGGADWIDLKEPLNGALGPVDPSVADAVSRMTGNDRPTSAALGELVDWQLSSELLTIPGIDVVKLGLAGCDRLSDWQSRWIAAFENCYHFGKQLAAVVYADWLKASAPHPTEVLACASRADCQYLLIDTFDKRSLSSIASLGHASLEQLLQLARQRGMVTVFAGSLNLGDLATVARLPVDIVAIRGAACRGDRNSSLDSSRVRQFRSGMRIAIEAVKQLNSHLTMPD